MNRIVALLCLLAILFSLTSCVSYVHGDFASISTVDKNIKNDARKVYLEEINLSAHASTWITINKTRNSGRDFVRMSESQQLAMQVNEEDCKQIIQYLNKQRPDVFTNQREGAIPARLEIDGAKINIEGNTFLAMLSGFTFFIVPSKVSNTQSFNLMLETLEDFPQKTNANCVLNVNAYSGGIWSPFVWFGLSGAKAVSFGMLNANDMWQNYYLTPNFANNAALTAKKLIDIYQPSEVATKNTTINQEPVVLPVATPEIINAPVFQGYPKGCTNDEDPMKGISSRRPTVTMSREEFEAQPVSTQAARYSFIGTWKGKRSSLSYAGNSALESISNVTVVFAPDGTFKQEEIVEKYNSKTVLSGTWRITNGKIEVKTKTKNSLVFTEAKSNKKTEDVSLYLVRWFDEDSMELIFDDLESIVLQAQQNGNESVTSIQVWYDTKGYMFFKTGLKTNINKAVLDTTSLCIIGRTRLHRVK